MNKKEDGEQPAQRKRGRIASNHWRPAFLAALAIKGVVHSACKEAGVLPRTAYRARARDKDFAEGWDLAMAASADLLEAEAIRRATEGVPKPVYHGGEQIGETLVYSDRLLEFLIKKREAKAAAATASQPAGDSEKPGQIRLTPEVMRRLQEDVKRFLPSNS